MVAPPPINRALVQIRANVGIPVIFPVRAEAVFVPMEPEGVTFDELAFADTDGDGTITGVELVTAQRQCVTTHPIPFGSIGSGVGDGADDSDAWAATRFSSLCCNKTRATSLAKAR